jgi:hypothetical protein
MYVNGKWFVRPRETTHLPTRTFFKKELIRFKGKGNIQGGWGLVGVYIYMSLLRCRPTECCHSFHTGTRKVYESAVNALGARGVV